MFTQTPVTPPFHTRRHFSFDTATVSGIRKTRLLQTLKKRCARTKNGVYRAKNMANKNVCLDFLDSLMYFGRKYGFKIIPKWLIKVPGLIAILFGLLLELSQIDKTSTNYGPSHPVCITKICFKKTRNLWEHLRQILPFHISTFWKSENFQNMDHRTPQIHNCVVFRILRCPPKHDSCPSVFDRNFQNTMCHISETPCL